jgi:hypothetical protein
MVRLIAGALKRVPRGEATLPYWPRCCWCCCSSPAAGRRSALGRQTAAARPMFAHAILHPRLGGLSTATERRRCRTRLWPFRHSPNKFDRRVAGSGFFPMAPARSFQEPACAARWKIRHPFQQALQELQSGTTGVPSCREVVSAQPRHELRNGGTGLEREGDDAEQ